MIIRQSLHILSTVTREMGNVKTYSPTYNGENMPNLTHTLDNISDRHFISSMPSDSTILKVYTGFSFSSSQLNPCPSYLFHWRCGNHTYYFPSTNGRILNSMGNGFHDFVRSKTITIYSSTRPSIHFNRNITHPSFTSDPITHSRHLHFLVLVSLLITGTCPYILMEYLPTPLIDKLNQSYDNCECSVSLYTIIHATNTVA